MKQIFLLLVFLILMPGRLIPHGQEVHQYIVKEAYELLVDQWGSIIPGMHDHFEKLDQNITEIMPGKKHLLLQVPGEKMKRILSFIMIL